MLCIRWIPFDAKRNWPDLGPRFRSGEEAARAKAQAAVLQRQQARLKADSSAAPQPEASIRLDIDQDEVEDDDRDLGWATVLKRTFESYIRGDRPNMVSELLSSWNPS